MPWYRFSTTKIKYLRKLSRLGLTPELLRRICACKASWNNRNNNWKKILTCGRALELTLDSSVSEKILVVFWKSSPRRVRLGISIRCVAHELKSILMRRANSQYVCMYVCMLKDIHTCIHIHTYMYGIGGFWSPKIQISCLDQKVCPNLSFCNCFEAFWRACSKLDFLSFWRPV